MHQISEKAGDLLLMIKMLSNIYCNFQYIQTTTSRQDDSINFSVSNSIYSICGISLLKIIIILSILLVTRRKLKTQNFKPDKETILLKMIAGATVSQSIWFIRAAGSEVCFVLEGRTAVESHKN